MANEQLQFLVRSGTDLNALQSKLQETLGLSEVSSRVLEHTYYDSFDWRIFREGAVLYRIFGDGEPRLAWRSLNSVVARTNLRIQGVPRFAHDLPAGHLRNWLRVVLDMRAILPQVEIRTRIRTFGLLDSQEKTVLRLAVEQHALLGPTRSRPRQLGVRLRILPVKGYHKPVRKALRAMGKERALAPVGEDLLLTALAAESRQPVCDPSRLNLHLQPDMRADAAARAILLRLFEIIKINEEGTGKDLDSEFLHDFRVAVRKTRSALSQIKGVFPRRVLHRYRSDFAWLGSVTGPTRDMDVYLLNFDRYQSSLPESIRTDLDPLLDFLKAHQKKEQAVLDNVLNSARYHTLMKSWHAVLHSALPVRTTLPNATRPIGEVADEQIMRVYRRIMKEGLAIRPGSSPERLHDLRKMCKKLRYLMECFQSLYPATKIREVLKVLKSLQENLGDFQDHEVQAASLKHFSHKMMEEGLVPPATLMAMGVLVEDLEVRQYRVREEFAQRFAKFAQKKNQNRFHNLLRLRRRDGGARK